MSALSAFLCKLFLFDNADVAQAGAPVVLLTEQYRMHPSIAAWPSTYFYHGQLVTPPATHEGYSAAFHALAAFPPLAFYDCRSATLAHPGRMSAHSHPCGFVRN